MMFSTMKKLIFVLCCKLFITGVNAQPPAGMKMPTNSGRLYGKLVDSVGKPVGDASILLLQKRMDSATHKTKDILVKGTTTQANGDFNLEGLPVFGQFTLNITAVSYHPFSKSVSLQPKMPAGAMPPTAGQTPASSDMAGAFETDLGRIVIKQDPGQLAGVTVTATTSRLRMDIDKKVFNVTQNIVSAGGTAVDVMKNVPSLNVDIDGNVTLRNASPQIYIDGRPTTLSLDQIPADAIESVEVITNPSAKYDASGGNAGILNIVLKKNKKSGYNGNISAGVDKRGAMNGGASFNVRQNKINLSLSTFGNQMRNHNTGNSDIRSLITSPNTLVNQNTSTIQGGGFLFGRIGADYFATNRATFSLAAIKVHGSMQPKDFLRTDSTFDGGSYISYSERNTTTKRDFNATGLQGGYKYLFPKQGEELTADFNFFSGTNQSTALYQTNTYTSLNGPQKSNLQQQILGNGTNRFITIQTDYVRPLKGNGKFETGARVQLRNLSNQQGNYFYNTSTGQFVAIPSPSSNYSNKDNVYAAYISATKSIGDFGYQLGLRAESSEYNGELVDTKQSFRNSYPISLFPSLFLSQKLEHGQELQMSYTRRVNRPMFMQLIPFIDSTDQTNWTRGSANLKPEFTTSLEASYTKNFGTGNSLLFSVYYKNSTNLITRFLDTVTVNSVKKPVSTYANANSGRAVGAELTSQNTITKWWDMNSNVNLYNSYINTDNITGSSQEGMWSWFAKMNNNFKLPKDYKIQLSGTYQSKSNLPVNQTSSFTPGSSAPPPPGGAQSAAQGYIYSNWGVDIAVQKSFLKNNAASVTLSVSDIFRTRKMQQYSISNFYIQDTYRLSDVPMIKLNFSFRFGQMDMSLFKRKNTKSEMEGTQGAMQGSGS